MNSEKIAQQICDELVSCSHEDEFNTVNASKDRDTRVGIIGSYVYTAIKESTLKYMNDKAYFFDGKIYIPVDNEVFYYALESYLKRMHVSMGDINRSLRHFIFKAFQSLRMCCLLEPTFHIMAFQNGVVNMDTGGLTPFSPDHHVIYLNSYDYDPAADCPIWKQFLREVLPETESRLTLQMYLGLGLLNRGKMSDKIENCLMLFGTGSNGKSVVHETVKGIFGSPNISEMGLMALIKGGDERYRNMNKIDGKVFNYCAEIQAKDISAYSDAFKSLCSGENQYARILGKDIYVVKNVPWLIFNMNNPPRSTDASYGMFRRFLYVVFDHVIPDEKQNKHLAKDLATEYPGILNWIMRGRKYLKNRHYHFPISENAERRKLLNIGETNTTLMWMKLRNLRNSSYINGELCAWLNSTDMYNDMVAICQKNGLTPDSHRKFALELRNHGWGNPAAKKRGAEGIQYRVYGMNAETFKQIPDIIDAEVSLEDHFEKDANYDPGDIN